MLVKKGHAKKTDTKVVALNIEERLGNCGGMEQCTTDSLGEAEAEAGRGARASAGVSSVPNLLGATRTRSSRAMEGTAANATLCSQDDDECCDDDRAWRPDRDCQVIIIFFVGISHGGLSEEVQPCLLIGPNHRDRPSNPSSSSSSSSPSLSLSTQSLFFFSHGMNSSPCNCSIDLQS